MKTYLKDLTPEEVIRRLKAGEVLIEDDSKTITKLVEGVWCTYCPDGSIWLNDGFNLNEKQYNYFETPDELKLEVGKCYKTRDGRKAYIFIKPIKYGIDYFEGVIIGELKHFTWTESGLYVEQELNPEFKVLNNLDLISEWSDDDVA